MKPTTITQLGDWYQEFPKFWESPGVNDIIKYISKEYQLHKVYPEPSNIFRAFELCQYKDLIPSNVENFGFGWCGFVIKFLVLHLD